MRNYLYLWNDPRANCLIASGIEFSDFIPFLETRGGLVADNASKAPDFNFSKNFDGDFSYIPKECIPEILKNKEGSDFYASEELCWFDTEWRKASRTDKKLSNKNIAEILFYFHKHIPLNTNQLPKVDNEILYYGRDNGTYLKLFYNYWPTIDSIVTPLLNSLLPEDKSEEMLNLVQQGEKSFWISKESVTEYPRTHNIAGILDKTITAL
jgi:hypothetical protein